MPYATLSVIVPLLAQGMLADQAVVVSLHARFSKRSLLSSLARAMPRLTDKWKRRIWKLTETGSKSGTRCTIPEAMLPRPRSQDRYKLQSQMGW